MTIKACDEAPSWLSAGLHPVYHRYFTRLAAIRWLVMDVDGVLTSGGITYTCADEEIKTFDAKDGQGLNLMSRVGIDTAFLTARQSPIVSRRARDLNITHVFQHAKPKWPVLEKALTEQNIHPASVAYMGDDWPDYPVLRQVGFAACPVDAIDGVKTACHWISPNKGGNGAMRDLCDLLLAAKGFDPYAA